MALPRAASPSLQRGSPGSAGVMKNGAQSVFLPRGNKQEPAGERALDGHGIMATPSGPCRGARVGSLVALRHCVLRAAWRKLVRRAPGKTGIAAAALRRCPLGCLPPRRFGAHQTRRSRPNLQCLRCARCSGHGGFRETVWESLWEAWPMTHDALRVPQMRDFFSVCDTLRKHAVARENFVSCLFVFLLGCVLVFMREPRRGVLCLPTRRAPHSAGRAWQGMAGHGRPDGYSLTSFAVLFYSLFVAE